MSGRDDSKPAGRAARLAVRWVSLVPRVIIGAIILAGIAINFANVIGRYVFLAPLPWAEEVMVFLVMWAVFVGAIAVTLERRHLVMDLVLNRLPPRWRGLTDGLALVALTLCAGYVCLQAVNAAATMARLDQRSIVVGIPMTAAYAAFVVGFGFMAAIAAVHLLALIVRRPPRGARPSV